MFARLLSIRRKVREAGVVHVLMACALCAGPGLLIGCGGVPGPINLSPPAPGTPPAPTTNPAVTAKHIYSIDRSKQSVDVYAANLNGTVSPTSSYAGGALAVTGDAAGNIYVGTYSSTLAGVQVYAAGATTASRSITVATATVNAPDILTLAVDSGGNLYVAIGDSILVYGPSATGSAMPIRTISGSLTLVSPAVTQMAFDADDNLYVAMGNGYKGSEVVEFMAGASGNVAPTVITAPDYYPSGVALDSAGQIYIVQGSSPSAGNGTYEPAIYVFPKGSVAGAKPSRTIAGSNIGLAIYTYEIFVDSSGNIFVGAVLDGQTDYVVYAADANGNASPASQLTRSVGSTTDMQFYVK